MSRLYQLINRQEKDSLTFWSWSRLLKNQERQKILVEKLLNKIKIEKNKKIYNIEEMQLVQEYWVFSCLLLILFSTLGYTL